MEKETRTGNFEAVEYLLDQEQSKTLKGALHRLIPIPSPEEAALRDKMVDVALKGESMQGLFPDVSISEATDHFLRLAITGEIAITQAVKDQQQSLLEENQSAFLATLCDKLTEEEQILCQDRLIQIQDSPFNVGMFLRRLNGEPVSSIAAESHVSSNTIYRRIAETEEKWFGSNIERMKNITSRLTPRFQQPQTSLIEELPICLPYLDREVSILAKRLDEQAFAYLVESLFSSNMTGREALLILARFNTSKLTSLTNEHPLNDLAKKQRATAVRKYSPHALFFQKFQRSASGVYENSDEATRMIIDALAASKTDKIPQLSNEEIVYYAKDVEAGVYAEKLLEQDEHEPHPIASPEELRCLVELGKLAIKHLLASHVDFVTLKVSKLRFKMESRRDIEELTLIGMRGLFVQYESMTI